MCGIKDATPLWAQRILQALKAIAAHPVNLDFASAASAPVVSRQLAQAWQAFKTSVAREGKAPHVDNNATAAAAASASAAAATGAAAQATAQDDPDDEEVYFFLQLLT